MTIRNAAYIAGVYEHPDRVIPDKSVAQIHAEVAVGALADAGLTMRDVDAYFCGDGPGLGGLNMAEYLGLRTRHLNSNETGGSSYMVHVGQAAAAIAAGKCSVALVTLAGRPRSEKRGPARNFDNTPEGGFEEFFGATLAGLYAMAARRHMHEFGTTGEQLAEVKVAASLHAQHNENALVRKVLTAQDVLASPMISDPLHVLDCCVITDGGGAFVVVSPEVARSLDRHCVAVLGEGHAPKHMGDGRVDLTHTGGVRSGPMAFEEAGVRPSDIDYVSIYDSFTITVLMTLEDLGFAEKGRGGEFVASGALRAPHGALPFNTDGGGLCNNHPGNRGGMTKIIEAVRQLRGEAHPAVQVPDCRLALAHGTGGSIGSRMVSATLILGREPR